MANKTLKFDLKREGFPIEIGSTKFFFGTSVEDLTRFFTVMDEVEKEIVELSKVIDLEKVRAELSEDNIDEVLKMQKELARIQYDAMLGEGAFEKIYAEFPYVDVLEEKFDDIALHVSERLEVETTKRVDKVNKKKAEAMKKKASKKK